MDLSDLDDASLQELATQGSPALQQAIQKEIASRATGGAKSYGRALGQAAFNLGDEFEAWARNGFSTGGDYDQIKAGINADIQTSYENNPLLYGVEFGAGALIPGAGLAKVAKGAKTIKGMMGRGSAVGGIDGAVGGYGASSDGNEVSGTLTGLGAGLGLGGILSGAIPAVTRFVKGQTDPEQMIRDAAAKRGIRPEDVVARMKELGDEALIADAFPEFAGLAAGAAVNAPFSQSLKPLIDRQAGAGQRVADEIERKTGTTGRTGPLKVEQLEADRSAAAFEDYAGLNGVTYRINEVQDLLDDPVIGQQINQALKAYASRSNMSVKDVLSSGEIPASVIHQARSKAGGKAEHLRSLPGGASDAADVEYVVRNKLDPLLDSTVPGYAQARENFARSSEELGALAAGAKLGRNNRDVSAEQIALERQTNPELRALTATGAQSQIANDIIANQTRLGSIENALGSSAERRAVKAEAGQMPWLPGVLARETDFNNTFKAINPQQGSPTAFREEMKEQFDESNAVLTALSDPFTGGLGAAAMAGWRKFVGKQLNIKNENVANKVLELLLTKGMSEKQIIDLIDNPDGATELMKFLGQANIRGSSGALTGAGLQGAGALYQEQ